MNEEYPYTDLILSSKETKSNKFNFLDKRLQENLRHEKDTLNELFALYIILNVQYQKWFKIASNKVNTNEQTKRQIESLHTILKDNRNSRDIDTLRNKTFINKSLTKIILQALQIDFFIYGDVLRNNEKYGHRWIELRRNLGLTILNVMLFYGIPAYLIYINTLFIPILLASFLANLYFAHKRTKEFYYINQLEKIKTQPNKT